MEIQCQANLTPSEKKTPSIWGFNLLKGSKSLIGSYSQLWVVLSLQKNVKRTVYIIKQTLRLRFTKFEGMCPLENRLVKLLKSWLSEEMFQLVTEADHRLPM